MAEIDIGNVLQLGFMQLFPVDRLVWLFWSYLKKAIMGFLSYFTKNRFHTSFKINEKINFSKIVTFIYAYVYIEISLGLVIKFMFIAPKLWSMTELVNLVCEQN